MSTDAQIAINCFLVLLMGGTPTEVILTEDSLPLQTESSEDLQVE